MIVAIERNKFTYLYKYNQIRIDINQFIDQSVKSLKLMLQSDLKEVVKLFNTAIPLFEQDHEIVILEVDKSKIKFHDGVLLSFDSILCIYPLTKMGSQLLSGKISDDFKVEYPVFENGIEELKIIRSMEFRKNTSGKILSHFNLDVIINQEINLAIEAAVKKNLIDKNKSQKLTTFLDHLVAYNKTPSYIPDGNIEHICKVGAIAIKYLDKPEEVFTNGPYYKSSIKYKSKINNNSYWASYEDFLSIEDDELKSSYEKMIDLISKDYTGINIFKVSYFFLAFKSFLNKHDNNIDLLNKEIDLLISEDNKTAAVVMSLLGYIFSFENIYEGLHRLSNAPLLKSTQSKKSEKIENQIREEAVIEKKKELERKVAEQEIAVLKQEETRAGLDINTNKTEEGGIAKIEKNDNVIISNLHEKVSEPIVIYEVSAKTAVQVNDKSNDSDNNNNEIKNDLDKIDLIEIKETGSVKEVLTVQDFRNYLLKELPKAKQKNWFQFLGYCFPRKNDDLTFEILEMKIDSEPGLKDKLLKIKKDKVLIKAFFDANK